MPSTIFWALGWLDNWGSSVLVALLYKPRRVDSFLGQAFVPVSYEITRGLTQELNSIQLIIFVWVFFWYKVRFGVSFNSTTWKYVIQLPVQQIKLFDLFIQFRNVPRLRRADHWAVYTVHIRLMEKILHHLGFGCPKLIYPWGKTLVWGIIGGEWFFSINIINSIIKPPTK